MQPVDLADLHSMTNGDAAMIRKLFIEFFIAAETYMRALTASNDEGDYERWRTNAHAFKDAAHDLGAGMLVTLCNYAQESYMASMQEKEAILTVILAEYRHVKAYLCSVHK